MADNRRATTWRLTKLKVAEDRTEVAERPRRGPDLKPRHYPETRAKRRSPYSRSEAAWAERLRR